MTQIGLPAYLQALSDVRSWHRWQVEQRFGDVRAMQIHQDAMAYLDMLIATKNLHAAQDEDERQRARAANSDTGSLQV
ncbi:hypothetical protein ACIQW5_29210 [Methylorubrum thiocyanatum]|uniref:hypothetical protein n=1 Tax=Methylorubrum thiocyanatum TaxID=47958 RepID=UPI00383A02C8